MSEKTQEQKKEYERIDQRLAEIDKSVLLLNQKIAELKSQKKGEVNGDVLERIQKELSDTSKERSTLQREQGQLQKERRALSERPKPSEPLTGGDVMNLGGTSGDSTILKSRLKEVRESLETKEAELRMLSEGGYSLPGDAKILDEIGQYKEEIRVIEGQLRENDLNGLNVDQKNGALDALKEEISNTTSLGEIIACIEAFTGDDFDTLIAVDNPGQKVYPGGKQELIKKLQEIQTQIERKDGSDAFASMTLEDIKKSSLLNAITDRVAELKSTVAEVVWKEMQEKKGNATLKQETEKLQQKILTVASVEILIAILEEESDKFGDVDLSQNGNDYAEQIKTAFENFSSQVGEGSIDLQSFGATDSGIMQALPREIVVNGKKISMSGEYWKKLFLNSLPNDPKKTKSEPKGKTTDPDAFEMNDEDVEIDTTTLQGIHARIAQLVRRRMWLLGDQKRSNDDTEVLALLEEEKYWQRKRDEKEEELEEGDVLKQLTQELDDAREAYAKEMHLKKGEANKQRYNEALRRYNAEVSARFGEIMGVEEFECLMRANEIGEQAKIKDIRAEELIRRHTRIEALRSGVEKVIKGYQKLPLWGKIAVGATFLGAGATGGLVIGAGVAGGAAMGGMGMRLLSWGSSSLGFKGMFEAGALKAYEKAEEERVNQAKQLFEVNEKEGGLERVANITHLLDQYIEKIADRARTRRFERHARTAGAILTGTALTAVTYFGGKALGELAIGKLSEYGGGKAPIVSKETEGFQKLNFPLNETASAPVVEPTPKPAVAPAPVTQDIPIASPAPEVALTPDPSIRSVDDLIYLDNGTPNVSDGNELKLQLGGGGDGIDDRFGTGESAVFSYNFGAMNLGESFVRTLPEHVQEAIKSTGKPLEDLVNLYVVGDGIDGFIEVARDGHTLSIGPNSPAHDFYSVEGGEMKFHGERAHLGFIVDGKLYSIATHVGEGTASLEEIAEKTTQEAVTSTTSSVAQAPGGEISLPESYTVKSGDSLTKIGLNALESKGINLGSNKEKIAHALFEHLKSISPDELKSAGVNPTNIDLIHSGDKINISKLYSGDVLQRILSENGISFSDSTPTSAIPDDPSTSKVLSGSDVAPNTTSGATATGAESIKPPSSIEGYRLGETPLKTLNGGEPWGALRDIVHGRNGISLPPEYASRPNGAVEYFHDQIERAFKGAMNNPGITEQDIPNQFDEFTTKILPEASVNVDASGNPILNFPNGQTLQEAVTSYLLNLKTSGVISPAVEEQVGSNAVRGDEIVKRGVTAIDAPSLRDVETPITTEGGLQDIPAAESAVIGTAVGAKVIDMAKKRRERQKNVSYDEGAIFTDYRKYFAHVPAETRQSIKDVARMSLELLRKRVDRGAKDNADTFVSLEAFLSDPDNGNKLMTKIEQEGYKNGVALNETIGRIIAVGDRKLGQSDVSKEMRSRILKPQEGETVADYFNRLAIQYHMARNKRSVANTKSNKKVA